MAANLTVDVLDPAGKKAGTVELPASIFDKSSTLLMMSSRFSPVCWSMARYCRCSSSSWVFSSSFQHCSSSRTSEENYM